MDAGDGLGERIRRLRRERGLSLARVAGEDFSRAFLNQVEHGRSQPSTRVLRVIASRLGTQVDYLISGSAPMLQAELDVETARLELARGAWAPALTRLRSHLELREWPVGYEARMAAARATIRLGRGADAMPLVAQAEAMAEVHGDEHRRRQAQALRKSGHLLPVDAPTHQRLGKQALREGRRADALEHLRSARVLAEASEQEAGPHRRPR
jgi:transcriptional regulator with XRE-family HTH domain